jgi:peptidoglycan L-alanyl-D-glutamate endopeptidase CwlK
LTWAYSQRSLSRLSTCHPDLQLLMVEALAAPECPSDITIVEGHRSRERQDELVDQGKSQLRWPKSRHNSWPSMAVDVAPYIDGSVSWDWEHFNPLAEHIKDTWARLVAEERITGGPWKLSWGGDWRSFKDAPHWQIDIK